MQQLNVYGGGVQDDSNVADRLRPGRSPQARTAKAEVSAMIETPKFPATMYAAFATAATCGALDFHGQNTQTDSYDSFAALVGRRAGHLAVRRQRRAPTAT